MLTRIITSVVALAALAVILISPLVVFTIALAAVILFMLFECYRATKADAAMQAVGFASAIMLLASMFLITNLESGLYAAVYMASALILLIYMALAVFEHGKRSYKDVLSSGFLTLYIVGSMWCLQYTRTFFGTEFMLLTFIAAWSCDTCAYFSGKFFGKRKLIPHVSPNKTVAGSVGGVVGSMLACTISLWIFSLIDGAAAGTAAKWLPVYLLLGAAFGGAGGIFSQFGDLAASAIKRDTGIKDFGWIFPGHGGFMDRFDSVMYIAPVMLMLMILLK